jgi:hypothetical protein
MAKKSLLRLTILGIVSDFIVFCIDIHKGNIISACVFLFLTFYLFIAYIIFHVSETESLRE